MHVQSLLASYDFYSSKVELQEFFLGVAPKQKVDENSRKIASHYQSMGSGRDFFPLEVLFPYFFTQHLNNFCQQADLRLSENTCAVAKNCGRLVCVLYVVAVYEKNYHDKERIIWQSKELCEKLHKAFKRFETVPEDCVNCSTPMAVWCANIGRDAEQTPTRYIVNSMCHLGYAPDPKGMCYGLAWTAMLACVRKDAKTFVARMQFLEQNSCETVKAQAELRQEEHFQFFAFFDTVTLAQTNYVQFLGYRVGIGYPGHQDINFPSQVLSENPSTRLTLDAYQVPELKEYFAANFTLDELATLLQNTQKQNGDAVFAVMIQYTHHAVSIGFDSQKWLAVNHDICLYTDNLHEALEPLVLERQTSGKTLAVLHFVTISNKSIFIPSADKKCVGMIEVSGIHNFQRALYLFLKENLHVSVTAVVEHINKSILSTEVKEALLLARSPEGNTGLSVALQNGCHKAVIAFFCAILKAPHFSIATKCKLLKAERADGVPGFHMALLNGHFCSVKIVMQAIRRLNLSMVDQVSWLAAAEPRHIPGLFFAMQEGHYQVVNTFVCELCEFQFSSVVQATLLKAARPDGVSGLHIAFVNNHHQVVRSFMQGLKVLQLQADQEEDLLSAKNRLGESGLFVAFKEGFGDCITAFIKELSGLPKLEDEQKKTLLEARNAEGIPGFYRALCGDNYSAVRAYVRGIGALHIPKEKK